MTDPTLLSDIDIDGLRQQHASARPTFGQILETDERLGLICHGPSVIWYDALHAVLPGLLDELTRCRTALADHIGMWAVYLPPLASDGPCAVGWREVGIWVESGAEYVDREADVSDHLNQ